MENDILLVGVDGGATKVNCWSIDVDHSGKFSLGNVNESRSYAEYSEYDPEFTPVDLKIQLAERAKGRIQPTDKEIQQAIAYTKGCADSIIRVSEKSNNPRVLLGVGMPGLKTDDQRGISAMANGPRQIDYAENLEYRLSKAGIELISPISHIGSDAFYCGLGEEYASSGQFRSVKNSYYLGGGTGAADALKLDGNLVSLDDIKEWFVKAWEMKCPEDRSIETYISFKGIQTLYGKLSNQSLADLNSHGIYPTQIRAKALAGDLLACETFDKVAKYLALLIYERITTLYAGWQGIFDFVNPNRAVPNSRHSYHGYLFDNIVIGQRLGDMLRESKNDSVLWQPFAQSLNLLICESSVLDDNAKNHYCMNDKFDEKRIVFSNLREAPALGAGIDAYLNYME